MWKSRLAVAAALTTVLGGCARQTQDSELFPAPIPAILQTGNSQWEVFPATFPDRMAVGPDKAIWFLEGAGNSPTYVGRLDLGNGTVENFSISNGNGPQYITVGPDGALWACGSEVHIERVTTSGEVTVFPQFVNCLGIAGGPGGFVYFSDGRAIGKMSADGTISEIATPEQAKAVAIGADGNIWFTESENHGYSAIAKVDPGFSQITEFKDNDQGFLNGGQTLVLGSDGRLYTGTGEGNLRAISSDGVMQVYHDGGRVIEVSSANDDKVWFDEWVSFAHNFRTAAWFDTHTHHFGRVSLAGSPCMLLLSPHVGPDTNVYASAPGCGAIAVLVRRILNVSPPSADISVGQTATFAISETGCACTWTAKSDDRSIASSTQPQMGQFIVTGIKPGSTSVTVADHKLNEIQVPIIVH